jgi:hypothetical protein
LRPDDAAAIAELGHVVVGDAQREAGHARLGDELAGGEALAGRRAAQPRHGLEGGRVGEQLHADRQGAQAQQVRELRAELRDSPAPSGAMFVSMAMTSALAGAYARDEHDARASAHVAELTREVTVT